MENRSKILVVQSDTKSSDAIRTTLQQRGWDVITASDALQAFSFAIKERPAAVLLSSQLPGGGGVSLLKRLRSSVHTGITPVIALADAANKREFMSAGATDCVAKSEEIDAALRRAVANPPVVREAPVERIQSPERLAALQSTKLLDSPPTEWFDALTQLTTKLLKTPVALVSLVDKDRQFFKSQIGVPEPWASSRQTPLSHSFCQWVVSSRDELVVDDARQHAGLLPNLALRDLGVVAYAGVPLAASDGQVVGSFCAVDSQPHTWSETDLAMLRDLCKMAEAYALIESQASGKTEALKVDATQVIRAGFAAATRVLERGSNRLDEGQRAQLIRMIDRLSQELSRSTSRQSVSAHN